MNAEPAPREPGHRTFERYLAVVWASWGVPPQDRDDCTQAVYVRLLARLGRGGLEAMLEAIGRVGVAEALPRDTPDGLLFRRAWVAVRQREYRRRAAGGPVRLPESVAAPGDGPEGGPEGSDRRIDLDAAIAGRLGRREAELVRAILGGRCVSEVVGRDDRSRQAGCRLRARALRKLREALDGPDELHRRIS